jgi:Laminin G domain
LALTLREGAVTLNINLGSGKLDVQIRPPKVRFDDNQWHRVNIHRKAQEVRWAEGKTLFRSFRSILTLPCTLFSIHLSTHADLGSNQFMSRKSRSLVLFLFFCRSFACTAGCQSRGVVCC